MFLLQVAGRPVSGVFHRPLLVVVLTLAGVVGIAERVSAQTIDKVNIRRVGTEATAEFQVTDAFFSSNVAGDVLVCDDIVLGMVIENDQELNVLSVTQDETSLSVIGCEGEEDLLGDVLEQAGLFNPQDQQLACRIILPVSCAGQSLVAITYQILEPEPIPSGGVAGFPLSPIIPVEFIAGIAFESDFDDGELQNAFVFDLPIPGSTLPIPALSEWGLLTMTLLLLAGARIYFHRQRRMAHRPVPVRA